MTLNICIYISYKAINSALKKLYQEWYSMNNIFLNLILPYYLLLEQWLKILP